ncbi:uncharacterized protein BX663DRAFT_490590 [Cokeromyces recurvatus]|uniref:uncharacterized protein n=1 Tax=Cokeromyces recurvatus TaxID=90255 RepID=UPI00221F16AE|nr:uncharacterized protein BX663DRAFT_490590 [Cokeromyces recurvatus]KAI7897762.1 hypothetical protein BX663DRAFT_490590 [Cokeromyces recurvatus]
MVESCILVMNVALFYQQIQIQTDCKTLRLRQARVELLELSTPLPSNKENDAIEKRKQRWEESASKAEQDKHAVESIIAGILSSHRNRTPSFHVDSNFEQRLHLCQLTTLVFGRFDALSTRQHVIAHATSSARRRRHRHESNLVDIDNIDDDQQPTCDVKRRQRLFSKPILPPFCRRHRIQSCYACRSPYLKEKPSTALFMDRLHKLEEEHDESSSSQEFKTLDLESIAPPPPPAGLIEAIPTFLRTSADKLRRALENGHDDGKPMTVAGQKVMGGGMPPRWYDLFLELLTQAAIESYLCDTQSGLEPIFEIFSYGDVEDEDPEEDQHEEDDEEGEEEDDEEEEEEGYEEEELDEWGIHAADHHLLFPKTRTMHLFKTQVREREKDFLIIEEGIDLQTHFERLAQRFPLQTFEKNMGEFIQMISDSMDIPALDKYEQSINDKSTSSFSSSLPTPSSANGPSIYKYPGDGSLLMPEIPDEDDSHHDNIKKRSAVQENNLETDTNKRIKTEE